MYDELKIGYFCASDSAKIGYEKKTNPTTRIAIQRLKDLITAKNSDETNFWFQNSNLGKYLIDTGDDTTKIYSAYMKDAVKLGDITWLAVWQRDSSTHVPELRSLPKSDLATSANLNKVKNKVVNVTLNANSWSGTASPFTYTVSNSDILSANTNVFLSLPYNLTSKQRYAYRKAQIESGVVSSGKVVLYAFGSKPSENIPITLSIGGDC